MGSSSSSTANHDGLKGRDPTDPIPALVTKVMKQTDCATQAYDFQTCMQPYSIDVTGEDKKVIIREMCGKQLSAVERCIQQEDRRKYWRMRGFSDPKCSELVEAKNKCFEKYAKENARRKCDAEFRAVMLCGLENIVAKQEARREKKSASQQG